MHASPLSLPPHLGALTSAASGVFMGDSPSTPATGREAIVRQAFERRMTQAWPEVTRLVERLLAWPGKAADVEDVVQDVFLSAWRHRAQFKGGAKWSTWVHQIAVQRTRTAGRARSRRSRWFGKLLGDQELEIESPPGGPHGITQQNALAGTQPEGDALRRALTRLPHADREVLVLRYLEELTVEEVAGQLGLTRPAVDARLSRARKRLRAQIGPGGLAPNRTSHEGKNQ